MKAIIRGRRYDTDKATLIGETAAPGYVSVNDFHYFTDFGLDLNGR